MDSTDRFNQVMEIFDRACGVPPEERPTLLEEACQGDDALRREVDALLAHDNEDCEAVAAAERGDGADIFAANLMEDAAHDEHWASQPLPERIGPFKILGVIGQGGMGTVYEAEQENPRRRVALKVIRGGLASGQLVQRFQREAHLLGLLQHPGIAQVYEAGFAQDGNGKQPYFAMEFVDGLALDEFVERHRMCARARMELIARTCDAVHYAHEKGIIHRDLKPANILVATGKDGSTGEPLFASLHCGTSPPCGANGPCTHLPKVLDFGVARITDADVQMVTLQTEVGQLVGTLSYMSPEQVTGRSSELDRRSDVYALGLILHELLAGKPPHDIRQQTIPEAARIIRDEEPSWLGSINSIYRGDIETIVSKALEKDPARRYQTAAEMASDIRRFLLDRPIQARPASAFYQLRKFTRRNRGLVSGLAAAMLAIIVGAGFAVHFALESRGHAAEALIREASALRAVYRTSIAATMAAIESGDPDAAYEQLNAAPQHLRNWEWRHLDARLDAVLARYRISNSDASNAAGAAFPVRRCAFRPDDTPIVAVARNRAIEIIDLHTKAVLTTVQVEGASQPTLAPDGTRLAALVPHENEVRIWDTTEATELVRTPIPPGSNIMLLFSGDGSKLVVGEEDEIRVLDASTGSRLALFPIADASLVDISRDASRLVAYYGRGAKERVAICSIETGKVLRDMPRFADAALAMAIDPNGTTVAWGTGFSSRSVRLLDAKTLDVRMRLRGCAAENGLTWSADGARLASFAFDGTLKLWDVASGTAQRARHIPDLDLSVDMTPAQRRAVCTLLLNSDDSQILIAHADAVFLIDLFDESEAVLKGHRSFVYLATFNAAGDTIVSQDLSGECRLWDAYSSTSLGALPVPWFLAHNWPLAVGFTGDGLGVIASLRTWSANGRWGPLINSSAELASRQDGHVRIHQLPGGFGRASGIGAVGFHGDWIVPGPGGEIVDVDSWGRLAEWGDAYGKDINPDGTRLVAGKDRGEFEIWDTVTLERVAQVHGHDSYVHDVAFSPDGTQIVSASGDYTLRIWDSIPRRERAAQAHRDLQLCDVLRPRIEALLADNDAMQALATFIEEDRPSPDEVRAARRLLLLYGLEDWHPPAQHGLPVGGAGVVVQYDARSPGFSREPTNPGGSGGDDWIWVPSPGDFSVLPHRDQNGELASRIRRKTSTGKATHAWYACSLAKEVVAAASRQGWRLRARFRMAPDSSGGFDLGYLSNRRLYGVQIAGTVDHSQGPASFARVKIPAPPDGLFHSVEIVLNPGSTHARIMLDGEAVEPTPEPAILTNDPLHAGGGSYVRGELTDSVFFGLAAGPEPGVVDVQFIEFEILEADSQE